WEHHPFIDRLHEKVRFELAPWFLEDHRGRDLRRSLQAEEFGYRLHGVTSIDQIVDEEEALRGYVLGQRREYLWLEPLCDARVGFHINDVHLRPEAVRDH